MVYRSASVSMASLKRGPQLHWMKVAIDWCRAPSFEMAVFRNVK